MKKYVIGFLIFCFTVLDTFAADVYEGNLTEDIIFNGTPVRITPAKKITTSKRALKVGSEVEFVTARDVYEKDDIVIKRNTPVKGKVISIEPNRKMAIQAVLTMGDFETLDIFGESVPLKGTVKKEGNPHYNIVSYLDFLNYFVRGGEVQVIPEEDYFIVFH